MAYFYQLFLNTDDVILKLYKSLCQKAKCTLFVWSTVYTHAVIHAIHICTHTPINTHMHTSVHAHTHMHTHTRTCTRTHARMKPYHLFSPVAMLVHNNTLSGPSLPLQLPIDWVA